MDNIIRNLEEIELTEAELETIYGAQGELEGLKGIDGLFCRAGTHSINVTGTSAFSSTCSDNFSLLVTVSIA